MGDIKKVHLFFYKNSLITFFYIITITLEPLRTSSHRIYRLKSSQLQAVFICSDNKMSGKYFSYID